MEIDRPDVMAEVAEVFARYEEALVTNDVDLLDKLFWCDQRTVRFGFGERLHGHDAIAADRRSRDRQTPPRRLRDVIITTFAASMAIVTAEFLPEGSTAVGRQSQTWFRLDDGWRVVSAHVSWEGGRHPSK